MTESTTEPTTEFWKLDLSKLTFAGWLLMLAAIVAVLAGGAGMLSLLVALGFAGPNNRPSRLLGAVAVGVGVLAGAIVFGLGSLALGSVGWRILRP